MNQVFADSPAEAAGFEQGDVVLELNGVEVEDNRDLTRRIGALGPDERARFVVLRGGEEETLTATLDLRDDEFAAAPEAPQDQGGKDGIPEAEASLPGITVAPGSNAEGVSVVAVEQESEAWDKGIRPGSVILTVSGEPVSSPAEIHEQVEGAEAQGRDAVLLLLSERGQERFVALRLETDES